MNDLYDAINEEDLDAINIILKGYPARLNEKKDNKLTPLHLELCWGKHKAASLLLSYGADVCVRAACGYTPLHKAVSNNDIQISSIISLLDKGADVNAKAGFGYEITPLDVLATEKTIAPDNYILDEIAKLLMQRGAHFYKVPVAAVFGTLKDVEDLINKGADIDDFFGQQSITWASYSCKIFKHGISSITN
jgi:ankyrin repeat protein